MLRRDSNLDRSSRVEQDFFGLLHQAPTSLGRLDELRGAIKEFEAYQFFEFKDAFGECWLLNT